MARTIAKDHEAKRLAILKTAAGFFADRGFERASMSQLAKACGVSKALIYHYYDSKDALLYDIVHTHLAALVQTVQTANDPAREAEQNLRRIICAILEAYRDADAEHKVQTEAMTSLPAYQRTALADLQRQIVHVVSTALARVSPTLYATHPEKLRPVTMSLFGMINWFYMWHRPGKGISREAYAELVADLVLRGVCGLDYP